jgi:hypothetical protein
MTNGQSSLGRQSGRGRQEPVSSFTLQELRVRAVARRRVEQKQNARWAGNRSRREKVRTLRLCAGALLVLTLGLYFGLARQDSSGAGESALAASPVSIG